MGIFNRSKQRDAPRKTADWTLVSGWPAWMVSSSSSGEPVTPTTALQLTAVYCCIKILSETVAELPLHLYRYTEDGGKVKAIDHPLYYLLHDEPNPEQTSFVFREQMMTHLCAYGNFYAQKIMNGRGEVVALYPLLPQNMTVERNERGELVYIYQHTARDVHPDDLETVRLSAEEVLHVPGLSYNGIVGFSPLTVAQNAIGASLAADKFSGAFYKNAALPSGVIEYPKTISDVAKFRENFQNNFAGALNSGKTPVLEDGMTYKQISISPQDAQFLETRKFNIDEIARIFRVPPHMLADLEKSSFSNIEQQSLEFVKYTIAPWVARIEQQLKRSLLLPDERRRMFFSFNLEGLLRGDTESRYKAYSQGRQNGWLNTNEIREKENMNRIPAEEGGDLYLVNGSMLPLSEAGAAYGKQAGGGENA